MITFSGAWTEHCAPGPEGILGLASTMGAGRLHSEDAWAWVLVEGGAGRLAGQPVEGRADVFEGAGWSALIAPGDSLELEGALRCSIFWRNAGAAPDGGPTRLIDPADVPDEQRGEGSTARAVRTYLPSGPFISGETINPPGGWSSWPPHRHDHEEIYAYRFSPSHGFGIHASYDRPRLVREGDHVRITGDHHPVVAAPGFAMCYLWALAGDEPTCTPSLDPTYA